MRLILASVLIIAGGAVAAAPMGGKQARKEVFAAKGADVQVIAQDALSQSDMTVIAQVAAQQPYYGAVAISLSEGLMSEATVAAANYHDVAPARDAALKSCEARRKEASKPCVIVAEIRPKGYAPRALQLSASATDALKSTYRKGRGPKALAISPSTGKWAIAKGEGAVQSALAQCGAEAGVADCDIAVQD